jgi:TM2 domain-containing membrane protein YozV
VFAPKAPKTPSGKSSSGSKYPASKTEGEPRSESRRRKRDEGDDDDDYDYDDDRPSRRRGGRRYRDQKSRMAYILLGIFLGKFGVHNFYAGRISQGVAQLTITMISIPLMCVFGIGFITILIPWIWAIVDIITVDHDADGVPMAS